MSFVEINSFEVPAKAESYDVRAMRAVRRQVKERLKIEPGEHVLITADFHTEREMIEAFASAVVEAGGIPTILIQPNAGWDPWPLRLTPIAESAITSGSADAIILCERSFVAFWGLPHGWGEKGKKLKAIYGSEQTWKYHGIFDIDREEMEKYYDAAKRIAKVIQSGEKVRITGKGGTDITAKIYGGGFETWQYLESLSNPEVKPLPWMWEGGPVNGCEVDITPTAGTAEGIVVWDGPVAFVRSHGEPIKMTVEKGKIVAVEGGADSLIFKRLLDRVENLNQIIELAAGLTPGWMPDGSVHGEKRGLGNCHMACGEWYPEVLSPDHVKTKPYYMHIDGAIYRGTMEIDGKKVIEEGKIIV
jgi:hypothetical protein